MNEAIKELLGAIQREYAKIEEQNTVISHTGELMGWRIEALKKSRKKINEFRKAIRVLKALDVDHLKVDKLQNEN